MFWPFNREQRAKARQSAATIAAIYGMIVAQARLPVFYEQGEVPDTVNGRFDMILLHLWLVMRRLRTDQAAPAHAIPGQISGPAAEDMAQGLLNRFCSDMDDNLREMGVSDLKVPKRMVGFAEAFYGRSKAYDAALDAGDRTALAQALSRNIFSEPAAEVAGAARLVDYVVETASLLSAATLADISAGRFKFAQFK